MVALTPFDMAWYALSKSTIGPPRETEGNYTGQEPATAEGRYGGRMTPEQVEEYLRTIERENREEEIQNAFHEWRLRNDPKYAESHR